MRQSGRAGAAWEAADRTVCKAAFRYARYSCRWAGPRAAAPSAGARSVDPERARDALGERADDTRRVENDGDRYGQHHELDEAGDLAGEQKEDRDNPADAQEQRPE